MCGNKKAKQKTIIGGSVEKGGGRNGDKRMGRREGEGVIVALLSCSVGGKKPRKPTHPHRFQGYLLETEACGY